MQINTRITKNSNSLDKSPFTRSLSYRPNPQAVEEYNYDGGMPSFKDPMHTNSPDSDLLYGINLQVKYKCNPGEKIGVSGNIKELGFWKDFKFILTPSVDDIWYTKTPILTNKRYFQYKYVVLNADGSLKSWERGVDRICDCDILPSIQNTFGKSGELLGSNVKVVELIDTWEAFHVKFMMAYPSFDTMDFYIDGNHEFFDFESMSLSARPIMWLPTKYGQERQYWEGTVLFPNTQGNNVGQF